MGGWQAVAQPQEVTNLLQHLVSHHQEEHLQHHEPPKWSSTLPAYQPLLSVPHGTISRAFITASLFSSRSEAASPKPELVHRARVIGYEGRLEYGRSFAIA